MSSSQKDPGRLLAGGETPKALREALRAAGKEGPSAEQFARIAAGLPLPPPGGGDTGGGGNGGGVESGAGASGASGAGAAAAAGKAALSPLLSGVVFGVVAGLATVGVSWLGSRAPDPEPAAIVGAQAPAAAAPSSEAAADLSGAEEPAAPTAQGGERGGENAPARPPRPGASAESGESESALLARAQDALAGDPRAALSLAEAHRARFPGGALAPEREVIAIAALMRLGRAAEAEAQARRLLAQDPRSAHRRRLEVLVPALREGGEERADQKIGGGDQKTE